MTRSVDDLILLAKSTQHDKALQKFSKHYHRNLDLVPFLVRHVRKQIRKFGWASFDFAWSAALMKLPTPGGPDYKMPAQLKSWYVRGIVYCHSDLNGRLGVHAAAPDTVFGMAVAKKRPGDYAGRLQWADGRPLTEAPTQAMKKTVQSVRPIQGELFEVA